MTLKELQHFFHYQLDDIHGNDETNSFFRLLAETYLNFKPVELALHQNQVISNKHLKQFKEAIKRLKNEEPIQYIIGKTEFYGLPINVNLNTLIPRPETEELVEWILNLQPTTNNQQPNILDIGTGSGCIAVALAKHLPKAKVYAIDVSLEALNIAKTNAELNKVEVNFIEANILTDCHAEPVEASLQFDIIVSNPPYVRKLEESAIRNNVLKYEPHLALFVENEDPLQFYRAICKFAVHNLKVGGSLYFEINQYLGKETKQLLELFNFKSVELKKDIFGNDRMLKSLKP